MTNPEGPGSAKAGWYPDSAANLLRYWDGQRWTDATQAMPIAHGAPTAPKGNGKKWALVGGVAAVAAVAVAVTGVVLLADREDSDDTWSAFPYSMGCTVEAVSDSDSDSAPPVAATVRSSTLTHLGENKLAVTVEFVDSVPAEPKQVKSPYMDTFIDEPGSLSYGVFVVGSEASLDATLTANEWSSGVDWFSEGIFDERELPDQYYLDPLTSVTSTGNTVKFVYNLDNIIDRFAGETFQPKIVVTAQLAGPASSVNPAGSLGDSYDPQQCAVGTPITDDAAVTRPSTSQAPATESTPAAPTASDCGGSATAAMTSASAQLPTEPITGREWSTTPIASNYDPCADLSTILVTVEGATGSSPVQALMFHRGEYLGTGTAKAFGFTDLDVGSSTNDTVVLTYKTGQTCNACNDGIRTPVEFHWDGTSVRMTGNPPN
ncbi:MAG: LppP/LprE family lipoprotein [Rhodococcus sp. (in: high G+C Gram-positive bacteria)]|uniref:LppP/LprE family lipoprotein n=1 Tax=Rhodococcus sp. TaxID=1831 RepID=UPI002AD9D5CE|nr:LppP/LprE family lipoprotein [Rhodococcus sp. (in: high G+C Gram-positive bacteria)]